MNQNRVSRLSLIALFALVFVTSRPSLAVAQDRICPVGAANTTEESIFEWHHEIPAENVYFELYAKGGMQNKDLTDVLTRLGVVPPNYAVNLLSVSGASSCENFPPTDIKTVAACAISKPKGVAFIYDRSHPGNIKTVEVPLLDVVVGQNIEMLPTALATLSISFVAPGLQTQKWLGRKASCYEEVTF